ncbi:MAG: alanyl-tRNA editing protein [Clostridia bacterium]|nr:alanyl-tRNA editing protein [Clostridia bacterium]
MKTVKLYEQDSYISAFEAVVLSSEADERGYKTVLSRTAFFPEGGGQPSDTGTLADIRVFDVQIIEGEIYHYTKTPLNAGEKVKGEIDFSRRFNFMQNHTAEHIVSGIVYKKFGFDNIGFHLNENEVTFDFAGFFTAEQLSEIEYEANKKVWADLPVCAYYPDPAKLKDIPYRAKSGIEGEIRLVEIENTDICACCAPHVKSTGEIGLIKFLGSENQHGGTRIFMKCGAFALKDYRQKADDIKEIAELLSAKPEEAKSAVLSQNSRLEAERQTVKELKNKLFCQNLENFDKSKTALILKDADMKDLQTAADSLHKTYGGVRTALSENAYGAAFAMCGSASEIAAEFEKLKGRFPVKGGGRDNIRQGSITASFDDIKKYFDV